MPLYVLVGDSTQRKQELIAKQKALLAPSWAAINTISYGEGAFTEALLSARTRAFADRLLVVWEGRELTKEYLSHLEAATFPNGNILILSLTSLNLSTKLGKWLKAHATVHRCDSIPSWNQQEVRREVRERAQKLEMQLPDYVVDYIASAVGNNLERLQVELEKLAICRGEGKLTLRDVRELIPDLAHSAFHLAEAMRSGQVEKGLALAQELLAKGEHPLQILGGVLAKFRLWLAVKSAIVTKASQEELLGVAGIKNPKQLYFLRQEVSSVTLPQLLKATNSLFTLQDEFKQGRTPESLPYQLAAISSGLASSRGVLKKS